MGRFFGLGFLAGAAASLQDFTGVEKSSLAPLVSSATIVTALAGTLMVTHRWPAGIVCQGQPVKVCYDGATPVVITVTFTPPGTPTNHGGSGMQENSCVTASSRSQRASPATPWRAGLTQRQMAAAAGLSVATIHAVEDGRAPRVATLEAIASALGVSVAALLGGP